MKKKIWSFLSLGILLFSFFQPALVEGKQQSITFADAGWESNKLHNAIAGRIAKEVFGYDWEETPGSTAVMHEGLLLGEVDVHMEEWTDNIPSYATDIEQGKLQELSVNYDDNKQGIYVPRYVIEGDEERGIEALAPDLEYIWDLKKYPELFPDAEQKNMGRLYGSIPGWAVDEALHNKFEHYDLDEEFLYFRPGSDTALQTAIMNAYDQGEPVAAYYWSPTSLLGNYDMVLLKDKPYTNEEDFKAGKTEFPSMRVTVSTSNDFAQDKENQDFIQFLENYETSSELTSEALGYMDEHDASYDETAEWFLKAHEDVVKSWLTEEQAQTLSQALASGQGNLRKSIFEFPFQLPIKFSKIDDAVRAFSIKHDRFFSAITKGLTALVTGIEGLLKMIPWFVLLLLVFIGGWKLLGSWPIGLLYSGLLFLIGTVGYWEMMNETLAIIVASVLISLLVGFPLGVLLAASPLMNKIFKPILDTMQTMPVFVYLIPALLFFGLGKAPGVIATTIYAVVPMIRLTSLGIQQIDAEVVEAAQAFGSTWLQALTKVKIPQALPTIMTGINQTLMMAISMVVTTSMIGVRGLGMEVLNGVNKIEIGRGLISGIAVVIVAVIIDRLTQGFINRSEVNENGK